MADTNSTLHSLLYILVTSHLPLEEMSYNCTWLHLCGVHCNAWYSLVSLGQLTCIVFVSVYILNIIYSLIKGALGVLTLNLRFMGAGETFGGAYHIELDICAFSS